MDTVGNNQRSDRQSKSSDVTAAEPELAQRRLFPTVAHIKRRSTPNIGLTLHVAAMAFNLEKKEIVQMQMFVFFFLKGFYFEAS